MIGVSGKKCKTWVCRDRLLGKQGNGCRMRIVKEDALLAEIGAKLGCEGEDFPVEQLDGIERVEVCQWKLNVIRKQAEG